MQAPDGVNEQTPVPAPSAAVFASAPTTPAQLLTLLADELEIRPMARARVPGHASPAAYLVHSFFEGAFTQNADGAFVPAHTQAPLDCVVWASRGGGKTFLGALATTLDLVFRPGIEIRILGGSMDQSRRMYAHLRRLFERPALAHLVRGRMTERRLRLQNGSEVELLAQAQASVRGTRVQKLRCDEVELFSHDIWEAAQLATRSKRTGNADCQGAIECFSTMHKPYGLMHELVQECREGRRTLFAWGLIDVLGPCGNERRCRASDMPAPPTPDPATPATRVISLPLLDPRAGGDCVLLDECAGVAKTPVDAPHGGAGGIGHVAVSDAIRMKGRVGRATWAAEMLCQRPSRTDAVVPEFDAARHVVDDVPRHGALVAGMDFGLRGLTVILWAVVDARGWVWVTDEYAISGELMSVHAAALTAPGRERVEWVAIDPAGTARNDQTGESNARVLERAGLRVVTNRSRVRDGLALIRGRLDPATGEPTLRIARSCTTLIRSLESYHYPAEKPTSIDPVKDGSDHAVDALRYLVLAVDKPRSTRTGHYVPPG